MTFAIPARRALLSSKPSWLLTPFIDFDCDFIKNIAYASGKIYKPSDLFSNANANGSLIPTSNGNYIAIAANTLPISDIGMWPVLPTTNFALWSRDFTNAAWVKVNATAAKDQIGIDGVSNSASSITSSLANATILQSITLTSAQRILSFFIKRISGTGTIKISQDGTTWTDITSQINSSSYSRVNLLATVLNPNIGIQIGTSGDKIAVDVCQLESGLNATIPSAPIFTTNATATRAGDVITLGPIALTLMKSVAGFVYYQGKNAIKSGQRPRFLAQGSNALMGGQLNVGTTVNAFDVSGSNGIAATLGSGDYSTGRLKNVLTWDAANRSHVANGGTVATSATPMGTITGLTLGTVTGGSISVEGPVERFSIAATRIADAVAKQLTF